MQVEKCARKKIGDKINMKKEKLLKDRILILELKIEQLENENSLCLNKAIDSTKHGDQSLN